jgi:16S rRNA (guanine(966)-N(2))-methyltransferase RsmD
MSANALRIIGGRWRGRRLRFPPLRELRPTPDRVRETLFNWLGQDLTGRSTLDLFAGSGALSIEALSRGASLAVAVDRNPGVVRSLEATAAKLGTRALETHCDDAMAFLARERRRYDVVFLDPPFAATDWSKLIAAAAARLGDGGVLYVEAGGPVPTPDDLRLWRCDKAGRVHYHLLRRAT